MQYRKRILFAVSGKVKRQFLQSRIMSHHHDVSRIFRQFAKALKHGAGTEGIEPMQHMDREIGGQRGQDSAHGFYRSTPG